MAAALSSCSKGNFETDGKRVDEALKLNVTVSNPCGQTKALIKTDWKQYDKISIWYDANTGTNPDLVIRYDGSAWGIDNDATVSGKKPSTGSGHFLKAVFEDKVAVAAKDSYTYTEGTLSFNLQTWTFLTEIQVALSGISYSEGFSAVVLSLSCSGFKPYEGFTIGEDNITAKSGAKGAAATCCLYNGDSYFVYATADYSSTATERIFTFKDNFHIKHSEYAVSKAITKPESGIKAIKISSDKFKSFPNNAINSLFSVQDGETAPIGYIHFSKGNLQAKWNGSNHIWYFADKQSSIIGNALGNTSIDSPNNGDVVDLFGWSTNATNSDWGIHTKSSDDYIGGEFKEWGQQIDNNGTWRTLTADEWEYLLERVNDKGELLNQVTYINYTDVDDHDSGNFGLILYPDNYSGDVTGADYTSAQWTSMQNAGCVFLPAAGLRAGSNVSYPTTGFYWTSSADEESMPYFMVIGDSGAAVKNYSSAPSVSRCSGCAVRLVTDVK